MEGDDDGRPKESIFHLQAVHVCILALGPGSDWGACCSLFA